MTNAQSALHELRVKAAAASHGISAEPIYRGILESLKQLNMTGDLLEFGSGTGNRCDLVAGRS